MNLDRKQIRQFAINLEAAYIAARRGNTLEHTCKRRMPESAKAHWLTIAVRIAGRVKTAEDRAIKTAIGGR